MPIWQCSRSFSLTPDPLAEEWEALADDETREARLAEHQSQGQMPNHRSSLGPDVGSSSNRIWPPSDEEVTDLSGIDAGKTKDEPLSTLIRRATGETSEKFRGFEGNFLEGAPRLLRSCTILAETLASGKIQIPGIQEFSSVGLRERKRKISFVSVPCYCGLCVLKVPNIRKQMRMKI